MEVIVKRIFRGSDYTIGHLYINGEFICDTIEDRDRMFDDSQSVEYITKNKVYSKTAIPTGTYKLTLNVKSPKYSQKSYYAKYCNGYMPRILNVKGFDGILLHGTDTAAQKGTAGWSAGCIIVGYNKAKGAVINTHDAFEKLYKLLKKASSNNEKITIKVTRTYK